ncbi:hypothetical protein EA462_11495 [Natrarchaeobius halalkaliphilus]|uniref:Uncharacterized protein n=1 Tax=Natrarchaeobius halalkaliphilus TaxID=1679091 RepID=A0A3N6LJS3_9EURY|nr:hypothetical protein [Natrarchaeobius halalkaliphilus]RQG89003.1 hypothetical protein EA462_11495 [Natrarchaeobius halalkaliphilus]
MSSSIRVFPSAIGLGIVLVLLGIGAYVGTGFASVTALIPAFFGVLIALFGVAGGRLDRERLATYGIVALSILGIVGSAQSVPDAIALLTGDSVDSVVATASQAVMILVCLVLLGVVALDRIET